VSPLERAVRCADRFQQSHRPAAFAFGVVKKFGDDRGGALAALLAYYGFAALFPLLLLLVTGAGFVIGRHPALEQRVLRSAVAQFPIIGDQLRHNIHSLQGRGVGLVVGVVGLVWGSLGVTQAGQHAMAQVWNVPGVIRPGFGTRLVRGLLFLGVLGLGVLATSTLSVAGTYAGHSAGAGAAALAVSTALNAGLFVLGFRVLTPRQIETRCLVAGAVVAGIGWSGLQMVGGYLVGHQLRHASQVYGLFAVVLGLLSWLALGAQLTLYAAEANVVRARRLWPRSIVQPPLTRADQAVLAAIARQEERRPEESVEVSFSAPAAAQAEPNEPASP
jgi:YihY family inner membrane protein